MEDTVKDGNCKPERRTDFESALARKYYQEPEKRGATFDIETAKDMVVMSFKGIRFKLNPEGEPEAFDRRKLREGYAEDYRQFDVVCFMQCLGEESKPSGNERPRYSPIKIEHLLHPNSSFAKHFDFDRLDKFRLACADCILADRSYAIVIDKAVKLPTVF